MSDKFDELTQLEIAYKAIKTQPPDAQRRMVEYLDQRISAELLEPDVKVTKKQNPK